jgi:hypothetical protein
MTVMSIPIFARLASLAVAGASCVCTPAAEAATIQTFGSGSAVSVVDRMATFDSLNSAYTLELNNYTEGGLRVTTGSQAWGADPPSMVAALHPFGGVGEPNLAFFGMANGTTEWVTIETANSAPMYAVEFMYGNTWSYQGTSWGNPGGFVEWQTLNGGAVVSSGVIGTNGDLALATILGFYDPAGFDQLQVKCRHPQSVDPNLQAIALDNLAVQLTARPPAPIIYGRDFSVNLTNPVPTLTVYDTIAGCQYRLVYTATLTAPVWSPVNLPLPDGWQSGGTTLTFTDPGAAGRPHRFYRVEAR